MTYRGLPQQPCFYGAREEQFQTGSPRVHDAALHDVRPRRNAVSCGTFSGPWMVNRKMQGTFSREKTRASPLFLREDSHPTFVKISCVTLHVCHLMTFLSMNDVEQNGHATREADNTSFDVFPTHLTWC